MPLPRSTALILATTLPALAAAQAIDVKTGLWETTVKADMANMASMVDTSKMTPEQKARIDAMMQKMGSGGGIADHKSQSCVTAEDLQQKSSSPIGSDANCEYTYTTRTSTQVAGTVSCNRGGRTQTGDFSFGAQGREGMAGTMHMHVAAGAGRPGAADMTINVSSRWLGNDCGDVKPRSMAKTR